MTGQRHIAFSCAVRTLRSRAVCAAYFPGANRAPISAAMQETVRGQYPGIALRRIGAVGACVRAADFGRPAAIDGCSTRRQATGPNTALESRALGTTEERPALSLPPLLRRCGAHHAAPDPIPPVATVPPASPTLLAPKRLLSASEQPANASPTNNPFSNFISPHPIACPTSQKTRSTKVRPAVTANPWDVERHRVVKTPITDRAFAEKAAIPEPCPSPHFGALAGARPPKAPGIKCAFFPQLGRK